MHKDDKDEYFDKDLETSRLADGKDWPAAEDCPGCPGRREGASAGYPRGGHKMSCSLTKDRPHLHWSPR